MKSICDPSFKYVPAAKQDLKATFARIRKEQKAADDKKAEFDKIAKRRIG